MKNDFVIEAQKRDAKIIFKEMLSLFEGITFSEPNKENVIGLFTLVNHHVAIRVCFPYSNFWGLCICEVQLNDEKYYWLSGLDNSPINDQSFDCLNTFRQAVKFTMENLLSTGIDFLDQRQEEIIGLEKLFAKK